MIFRNIVKAKIIGGGPTPPGPSTGGWVGPINCVRDDYVPGAPDEFHGEDKPFVMVPLVLPFNLKID